MVFETFVCTPVTPCWTSTGVSPSWLYYDSCDNTPMKVPGFKIFVSYLPAKDTLCRAVQKRPLFSFVRLSVLSILLNFSPISN